MNRKVLLAMATVMLALLACSAVTLGGNRVVGSGKVISEARNVSGFTSIELAGSADVDVKVGTTESVTVRGDDNIVPLIETTVQNGKLVINTKPNAIFTSTSRVQVSVVTKSVERIILSGSGNINVSGVAEPELDVEVTGSGQVTARGSADRVRLIMDGSGNLICNELKAHSATAEVSGSGTITLFADESLDATVSGSGAIRYEGKPPQVTKNITGSGSITP